MNGKPLISVIICFLNAERFIEEAVSSVFAQTCANWELLLVDDGSSDGSTEIALRYVDQHPQKVRYFEHAGHQNRGLSASRNLGISKARGGCIAFLDSDDVWLPYKLEQQMAILDSQPEAGMIYGAAQYWHSWTGRSQDAKRDHVRKPSGQPNTLIQPPKLLTLTYPLGNANSPCPSDFLLRREVVERVGGFEEAFRGHRTLYEDQAFLAKVYLRESVFVAGECWIKYRIHPNSVSAVAKRGKQHRRVRLFFLSWLAEYLQKQGVEDPEIWEAVRKALWPYHHPVLSRLSNGTRHLEIHMKETLKSIARQTLPAPQRRWLRARFNGGHRDDRPPLNRVQMGALRRVTPIDDNFGFGRGLPIDRYYIERFLDAHAPDVRGRVLEVADASYTRKFGGDRVTHSDVLHVTEGNPEATIVGDLACADHIPSNAFDCVILTQTLHLIYDMRAAVKTLYRILKPGGVLLVTVPGISQIDRYECKETWYWSLTTRSARRLFEEAFAEGNVLVEGHGNVLAAVAFLYGLAVAEMQAEELNHRDPAYEVLITVKAVKPEATS